MSEAWLVGAKLDDATHVDIAVRDGIIAAITPAGGAPRPGAIDLGGRLVIPALVDGHIHLDKTLLGLPWQSHRAGDSVAARIAAEKQQWAETDMPVSARARTLARQILAFGTTRLRCHVDIDPTIGLSHLRAVQQVADEMRDLLDIQIVAFPQSGILAAPGTEALMDAALSEAARVVGGLDPAGIDGDIEGHLGVVFRLALRHDAAIDIHLHDPGSLGTFTLRRVAHHARSSGLAGRCAVSHAFALGDVDADEFARTADALAEAGVAIMTNGPGPVPMPPVAALIARGVVVFAGSDNIRDAWSPYGNGDMLERAMLIGYRAGLLTDTSLREAFSLVTTRAAQALGMPHGGVAVGMPADLIALQAAHVPEVVASRPRERWLFRRGLRVM